MKHWQWSSYNGDDYKCPDADENTDYAAFVLDATCLKCLKKAESEAHEKSLRRDIYLKLVDLIEELQRIEDYKQDFEDLIK